MLDFQTAVGSLILLAALMYAAYNVSHNGLDIFNGSDGTEDAGEGDSYARTHSSMPADEEADQKVAHNNHGDKDSSYGNGNGNNNSSDSSGRVFKVQVSFHVIMCLASCYMAMLFTNWTPSNGDSKDSDSSTSRESWWVQAIAQWITYLLYVWTLVAPLLFPDRDFSGRI